MLDMMVLPLYLRYDLFPTTDALIFTLVMVSTCYGPSHIEGSSVMTCDFKFHPPKPLGPLGNCTLVCSLHLFAVDTDEVAICRKNSSTPVPCTFDSDCSGQFGSSFCKKVFCFCETQPDSSFIPRSPLQIRNIVPNINVCVVDSHWKKPPPLAPFPWKTLLIVCGTLVLLGGCLMGLRWLSPVLRAWREERERSMTPLERGPATVQDTGSMFTFIPCHRPYYRCYFQHGMSHLCRLNYQPCRSWNSQRRSRSTSRNSPSERGVGQDKPPAYETVVQNIEPPPPYDELQQQPSTIENESNIKDAANDSQSEQQSQEPEQQQSSSSQGV